MEFLQAGLATINFFLAALNLFLWSQNKRLMNMVAAIMCASACVFITLTALLTFITAAR